MISKKVLLAANGPSRCYIFTIEKDIVSENQPLLPPLPPSPAMYFLQDQRKQSDLLAGTTTGSNQAIEYTIETVTHGQNIPVIVLKYTWSTSAIK